MTTNNEIPSESRQQVIDQLKNTKNNIILTSNIFGLPEAYLQEYKKQSSPSKLITLTEVHEIHQQILPKFSSYVESSLTLDLCKQLLERGFDSERLEQIYKIVKQNQTAAIMGNRQVKEKRYQTSTLLQEILDMICGSYEWEWMVLNYDKPMVNAELIQKTMYYYMSHDGQIYGSSRVIMSAYDKELQGKHKWKDEFDIILLPDSISYEQIQQECMLVLHNLYPKLQKYEEKIARILKCLELRNVYEQNNMNASIFMDGMRKFYDAYSCFCANGYLMTDTEMIVYIQEYTQRALEDRNQDDIKKPKLYI